MAKVSASIHIDKPLAEVWDYVIDYHNAPNWIFGVEKYEPVGEPVTGVGSTVDMKIKLGPTSQTSVIKYHTWIEHEKIAFESISGLKNSGANLFEPDGDGVKVTIEAEMTLPGGLAGKVLAKTMEPAAKMTASQSLKNLKKILEG